MELRGAQLEADGQGSVGRFSVGQRFVGQSSLQCRSRYGLFAVIES